MGRELEMPLQLAGVRVERHDGAGVEVVALPLLVEKVRIGIAYAPISEVERGIVRARRPDRAAADLPRIGGPGVVARLSRARNGVEPPGFLAGVDIVGRDESSRGILATSRTDDDLVFDHQRGVRDGVPIGRFRDGGIPPDTAAHRVESNEVRVDRPHEQCVTEDGHAAIRGTATRLETLLRGVLEDPERTSCCGIDRGDVIGPRRQVHDTVDDERSGLERPRRKRLVYPFQLKVFRVGWCDGHEQAVPLVVVRA